jgi:hypothetical protein
MLRSRGLGRLGLLAGAGALISPRPSEDSYPKRDTRIPGRRLEKSCKQRLGPQQQRGNGPRIRITLALTGALATLCFSAATGHADSPWPDGPTPFGPSWGFSHSNVPWIVSQDQQYTDFSVRNDPSETFVGLTRADTGWLLDGDENTYVVQDISGNVPVGEQYNYFWIGNDWGMVYNSIGGTPEAFYITPFGDINVPTWFVEAVGPTFFEPSAPWLAGLYDMTATAAATLPAAELAGLAPDVTSLLAGWY